MVAVSCGGAADALDGTSWIAVQLGPRPTLPDVTTTASFADGRIEGSGGCNTYSGTYRTEADSLAFGVIGGTERSCGDLIAVHEAAYFAALEDTASFQIVVDRLELMDAGGEIVLAFRRNTAS